MSSINNSIKQIVEETISYLKLYKEYSLLELTEKIAIFVSTLVMIFIFVTISMMALFILLLSFAYWIAPYVGGMEFSLLIVVGITIILSGIVYLVRDTLITNPIVRLLHYLFFSHNHKNKEHE